MSATTSPSEDLAGKATREKPAPPDGSGDASSSSNSKCSGITRLRNFLRGRRLELGMLVTRVFTLFCIFGHIFPIFGSEAMFMRRALLANAATSGIRLYQRLKGTPFSLSKEFIAHLIIEDSCHHLIYSIIFMFFGPISMSLVPIILFSSLHVANFTLQMMEVVNGPTVRYSRFGSLLSFLTLRTPWVLKMAATAEIFLMGVILFNCFRGGLSIAVPLLYYRFLYLRYASRRNQYTKIVFYEMRTATEKFIAGGCPGIISRILRTIITVLCKLAPGSTQQ